MHNYIVYTAFTKEEIYGCCYSLLKYLDVYNLKPPSDHAVVVYTNDPASLEVYGSFFHRFELRELMQLKEKGTSNDEINPGLELIKQFPAGENILYLGSKAYPQKEIGGLFSSLQKGVVYSDAYSVLGINPQARQHITNETEAVQQQTTKGFIGIYEDLKEFSLLLQVFFDKYQEESIPNQVKLMHHIDAQKIEQEKRQFLRLPFLIRMMKKLAGQGWSISRYLDKI